MGKASSLTFDLLQSPEIDMEALCSYRLERLREQQREQDIALAILSNPLSLRYAVDHREYQLFQSRIPSTNLFLPTEGPVTFYGASQRHYRGVADYRPAQSLAAFDAGFDIADRTRRLADEVKSFLGEMGVHDSHPRVAVERVNASFAQALMQSGIEVVDMDGRAEKARAIKSAEEIECLKFSIAVGEYAMALMREASQPGITENQLWGIINHVNVAHDGHWTEGRMLASGPRSNPWLQEASDRVIEAGDMIAFDTDMVGPFGYLCDISRSWLCGEAAATQVQRDRYRVAYDEVQHNMKLLKPGMTFKEFSDKAYLPREEFIAGRYPCVAHGVGLSDEYPKIYYRQDWDSVGYDGVFEPGMTICIESFTGSDQGGEGVKLEEMVLITENGIEQLSHFPFEEELL